MGSVSRICFIISTSGDQAMTVHFCVSLSCFPLNAILRIIDKQELCDFCHETGTVIAAHFELCISGRPLVGIQNPSFEVGEHFLLLERIIDPHAHVSSPGDSTDVDNVPALLTVVEVDRDQGIISRASVLKDVVASVGVTVNNTKGLIGLSDIRMSRESEETIGSSLV